MNRRSFLLASTATLAGAAQLTAASAWAQGAGVSTRTCYGFSFAGLDGEQINLGELAGRPIMVVNTASLCGFTPQYKGVAGPLGTLFAARTDADWRAEQ